MKKFKKVAILIATAALACGAAAMTACSDSGSSGGQVNQEQWTQRLTVNIESYDSLTATAQSYNTFSKSEAAEYGEWDSSKYVTKVNNTAKVIYVIDEHEYYAPDNEKAINGFVKETRHQYTFEYNGSYYNWSAERKGEYDKYGVYEKTKADFINEIESVSLEFSMLQMYSQPAMYQMFKYNAQTQTYEMLQGGISMGLQFPAGGGVKMIVKPTSIECSEMTLEGINSTTVTVPQQAYTDVDAYLANKASKGNK